MRSANESNCVVVPGCLMQVPPPQAVLNAATGIDTGALILEFAGVVQST